MDAPQADGATGPEDSTLVPVLLALAAGHAADANRHRRSLVRTYLGTTLDSEATNRRAGVPCVPEGVLDRGATTGRFELSEHGLRQRSRPSAFTPMLGSCGRW